MAVVTVSTGKYGGMYTWYTSHDSGVQQAASTTQPQSGKHAVGCNDVVGNSMLYTQHLLTCSK